MFQRGNWTSSQLLQCAYWTRIVTAVAAVLALIFTTSLDIRTSPTLNYFSLSFNIWPAAIIAVAGFTAAYMIRRKATQLAEPTPSDR